jgi:hypothetical protein
MLHVQLAQQVPGTTSTLYLVPGTNCELLPWYQVLRVQRYKVQLYWSTSKSTGSLMNSWNRVHVHRTWYSLLPYMRTYTWTKPLYYSTTRVL